MKRCILLLFLLLQWRAAAAGIEIIEARYGTQNYHNDVTELVRQSVKDNTSGFKVSNQALGDPDPGTPKVLTVKLKRDGKPETLTVIEGGVLTLGTAQNTDSVLRKLRSTILDAYGRGDRSVRLTPGIYRLTPANGETWHMVLSDLTDFEIDGSGCTFIMEGRNQNGIRFQNCRNVTLKGVTFNREVPPFSQGVIRALSKNPGYIDIEIDAGYPADMDYEGFRKSPVINAFSADGKPKFGVRDLHIQKIEHLQDRLFRFYLRYAIAPDIPVAVGDAAAWRCQTTHSGEIGVNNCTGMRIEDVTIRNAVSTGIIELGGNGDNYFNYKVTYGDIPPGATAKPLLSAAADGFHSSDVRKGATLENCLLEGMHDDGVNIHGMFGTLADAKGDSFVLKKGTMAIPRQGDSLLFYDADCAFSAEIRVKAVDVRQFDYQVTLASPLPDNCRTVINHDACGNGFTIRNCVTRNHRGIGYRLRSGEGIIENCLAEDICEAGIVVAPEFANFPEGPYARNLIIRNNTLRRTTRSGNRWGGAAITLDSWQRFGDGRWGFAPLPGGHRNILIEGNVLEDNDGPNLVISSAVGVTVKDNQFNHPMSRPSYYGHADKQVLVLVTEAKDVVLSGNQVIAPGPFMSKTVSASPSAMVESKETGFHIQK